LRGVPGKAVQDSADSLRSPMLLDQTEAVVPGVLAPVRRAAVNHDGQLGGAGHIHLPDENGLLHVAGGMVVEVVQADLAPSDDFRVAGELLHAVKCSLIGKSGLMRMDADSRVDEFVLLCELDAAI